MAIIQTMRTQVKHDMPSGRSKLVHTALHSMALAMAMSLLGLVLAYWTWAWWAPSPLPGTTAIAEPASPLAAASGLFGKLPGAATADAPTGLAVKLLGVIAGEPEGTGYALLQLDAKKTRVVRAGGYLAPGIRVEKVFPQQVILQRDGVRETLVWPRPVQPAAPVKSPPVR
ncbi:MAG: type II secretion system protein N [Rhodanobacter sp.]